MLNQKGKPFVEWQAGRVDLNMLKIQRARSCKRKDVIPFCEAKRNLSGVG